MQNLSTFIENCAHFILLKYVANTVNTGHRIFLKLRPFPTLKVLVLHVSIAIHRQQLITVAFNYYSSLACTLVLIPVALVYLVVISIAVWKHSERPPLRMRQSRTMVSNVVLIFASREFVDEDAFVRLRSASSDMIKTT